MAAFQRLWIHNLTQIIFGVQHSRKYPRRLSRSMIKSTKIPVRPAKARPDQPNLFSLRCPHEEAFSFSRNTKTLIRLRGCAGWSDPRSLISLRWAHRLFCRFCRYPTHSLLVTCIPRLIYRPLVKYILLDPGRPVQIMGCGIGVAVIIRRSVVHQVPGRISYIDQHLFVAGRYKLTFWEISINKIHVNIIF